MNNNVEFNVATKGDDFVGITCKEEKCTVTFPIGYRIPDNIEQKKESFLSLVGTFALSKNQNDDYLNLNNSFDDGSSVSSYSFFWLINDYLINGLYSEKETTTNRNSGGKIDWKKTIQNTSPIISYDSFVYLDPYYSKTRNNFANIAEIEKYCLNISLSLFGWYFENIKVDKSIFNHNHIDYMSSVLKNELNNTYIDSKKIRLRHMLNILNGIDNKSVNSEIYSFGTYNYENVWEKLILNEFGNEDVKNYYTNSIWMIPNDNLELKQKPLRPDAIYHDYNENLWFILDAKYYGFASNKNGSLPSTDDIEKQITYAQHIENNEGIDCNKIYNAFIMPYDKENCYLKTNKNDIEYIGYSNSDWISNVHYDKVLLYLADTKFILDNWKNYNRKYINDLVDSIKLNADK